MDQTVNANLAKCIQEVNHFGYTTYHNICSGIHTDLGWGFGGWAAFCGLSLLGLLLLVMLALFGKILLSDI